MLVNVMVAVVVVVDVVHTSGSVFKRSALQARSKVPCKGQAASCKVANREPNLPKTCHGYSLIIGLNVRVQYLLGMLAGL